MPYVLSPSLSLHGLPGNDNGVCRAYVMAARAAGDREEPCPAQVVYRQILFATQMQAISTPYL